MQCIRSSASSSEGGTGTVDAAVAFLEALEQQQATGEVDAVGGECEGSERRQPP
jgi:hypothetical protein